MTRAQRLGVLMGTVSAVLVGVSFVASSMMAHYPFLGGQSVRYALGFLLLAVLCSRRGWAPVRRLTPRLWVRLTLVTAAGLVGFNVAVLSAERTAEPAVPGVVVGCTPVVVAILAPLLESRRPSGRVACGALVVAAGAAVVQGFGRTDGAGLLWSLAAMGGEVVMALFVVPVLRVLGPLLLTTCACAIAAVEAAVLGLAVDGPAWVRMPDGVEAAALAWQILAVTVLGIVLWFGAIHRIGAVGMALLSGLIPVSAALTAPLAGTGSFGPGQLLGSLLVAGGVALGAASAAAAEAAPIPVTRKREHMTEEPEEILFLSRRRVESLFDPGTAIESQRAAFAALGDGTAELPEKILYSSRFDGSIVFCYAARLSPDTGAVSKFGSVNQGNTARGLPNVHALITALDPETGRPVAVLDGTTVTTLRTAAGSALAVDVLARPDATRLAVIGSGVQARAHVRAIARVRPLSSVRIWSPTPRNRQAAAAELAAELGLAVEATATAEEAVAGADIVAACTLSEQPVVLGSWLPKGCTVVSVGSVEPTRCETDPEVLRRARAVVVDDPGTAAGHCGPVVTALRSGDLVRQDLIALGDVVVGRAAARTGPDDIVFYGSVGLGVQDAAAAWAVIDRARGGRGTPAGDQRGLSPSGR
ncbi:EamA family transporter [Streptomyces sp. DSM 40750]|uniref:EamA family transporter n=1 Tax=Streptomyces sp. DSM 40750 TaxID=2801030 RepID=UPI00214BEFF9|nr:EamA family transporter [Streptomyces sp. DSM 40750]UUU20336.1 EamA family transporter [Streptomyces sp. DSM 40750]